MKCSGQGRSDIGFSFSEASSGWLRKNSGSRCDDQGQDQSDGFCRAGVQRNAIPLCQRCRKRRAVCRGSGREVLIWLRAKRLSRLRAAAIAQLNGAAPFSTGYYLTLKWRDHEQLRCDSLRGMSLRKEQKIYETDKA